MSPHAPPPASNRSDVDNSFQNLVFGKLSKVRDLLQAQPIFLAGSGLAALMAISWLIVAPWGNFPVNDDWAYAGSVLHLVQESRLRFSDWTSPFALPMILSGSALCKVFGFSHVNLRLVTLAWSLTGFLFLNGFLKNSGVSRSARLLVVGILFFNPLYFLLSFSFHTDVSFLALMFGAIFFLQKADQGDTASEWAASIFCAAAILTRQIGIVLPVAATLWWMYRRTLTSKRFLRLWLVPLTSACLFAWWFRSIHGPTWAQVNYVFKGTLEHIFSLKPFIIETSRRTMDSLLLSALFASPLLFMRGEKQSKKRPLIELVLVIIGILLIVYIANRSRQASFLDNLFHRHGLGTLTIYHSREWKPAFLWEHIWLWRSFTAFSAISLWLFLRRFAYATWSDGAKFTAFLTIPIAFATLPGPKYFDRYVLQWFTALLILFPILIRARTMSTGKRDGFVNEARCRIGWGSWTVLGFWIVLSSAGTRDYFAWNTAKWTLGNEAARRLGISQGRIANGFDWNAYWNYEVNMAELKRAKPLDQIGEWEWDRFDRVQAIISYAPDYLPPEKRSLTLSYTSPLAPRGTALYLYSLHPSQSLDTTSTQR